jgi:hypothetical protein
MRTQVQTAYETPAASFNLRAPVPPRAGLTALLKDAIINLHLAFCEPN